MKGVDMSFEIDMNILIIQMQPPTSLFLLRKSPPLRCESFHDFPRSKTHKKNNKK